MKLHHDIKLFTQTLRAASQHLDIKLEFVEKDYWITRFQASAGEKWGKLKENLNVLNAHDILDNI